MNWYIHVLKNCFYFSGRARRKEYWMFMLFNIIFSIVAMIMDSILFGQSGGGILYGIYTLILLVPTIAVGIRRLHDVGKSGWWLLIGLIPVLGGLLLLYWAVKDGERGTNHWGPSAKYA